MKLMVEGQMVEVDDSFDQMSAADQEKTVNEIAASMGIKSTESTGASETSFGGVATQLAAPAITGAAYAAPTGLAKVGGDIADLAKTGIKSLAARPLLQTAADVAGIAHSGIPLGSAIRGAGQIFGGAVNPMTVGDAVGALGSAAKAAPGYVAGMVGPALRGAARVAGPAGMAYNLAEAYPYLQQADIGNRVASGQIPQAMQTARQAPLNAPTPAPLSPQQAANLMASGDQRTIDIYGGAAKLAKTAQPAAPSAVTMPTGGLKAPSASQDPKVMAQYIALQKLLDSQRRQPGQ